MIKAGGVCIFTYSFELMDSRMYMIREEDEMLVVDPCEDDALLQDAKGVQRAVVLLTHEHYDHISGVNWLKSKFDCRVYAGSVCAERVQSVKDNLSSRFAFLFILDKEKYDYVRRNITLPYACKVDESFKDSGAIKWRSHIVEIHEVGGHSPGSSLILFDRKLFFAGDNVLGNGRELWDTDAKKQEYACNVLQFLHKLDEHIYVLPGHGDSNILQFFMDKLPCGDI